MSPYAAPAGGYPAAAGNPALAASGLPGGVRLRFDGQGGDLFVTLLVGYLLTIITLGIYAPWLYCRVMQYVMVNGGVGPTRRGDLRFEFQGRGGELFVTLLAGYLLTVLTLGIYGAWFAAKLLRFFNDNVVATAADGTRYRAKFQGTGGELLVTLLVGYLLTILTLGIYMPWFYCKLRKLIASRTVILENDHVVGAFDFEGRGGELFVVYLAGYLLTLITAGIYAPWFSVKLTRFFAENSRVHYQGRAFAGGFHGTGGELFVLSLVGYLLTIVTLGIYLPWLMVKVWKFQFNHHEYREVGGASLGMPAFGPPAAVPALGGMQ